MLVGRQTNGLPPLPMAETEFGLAAMHGKSTPEHFARVLRQYERRFASDGYHMRTPEQVEYLDVAVSCRAPRPRAWVPSQS
jgi:hypothetical protein